MPSNPVVKLKRGAYSALDLYPTIDGQLYFATNANQSLQAGSAMTDDTPFNLFVVDIENGNSVERKKLDAYRSFYAQAADEASSAGRWSNARAFKISDSNSHIGETTSVDGGYSAGYTLKLPSTIQAAFIGNLTGTADKAKILVNSSGIAYNVGSANQPVYFEDGIPKAVTDQMGISAESAGKWTNARVFKISDNDATNTEATGTNVDGSVATYVLKLPATIKATLTGRATSATKLVSVSGSTETDMAVGSESLPVYFANGVPVATSTTLGVSITGNAVTADSAGKLITSSAGSTSVPVYFADGRPVAVTSLDATKLSGIIPDACFPAKVLERLYIAADEDAMQALDATAVQAGDTVRVGNTNIMYYVVDKTSTVSVDDAITGTNFIFIPYAAGTTANAVTADSAGRLTSNRTFSITGGATATAVNFNGTGNVALNVTALNVDTVNDGTLAVSYGGTGKTSWTQYGLIYASATNALGQLKIGTSGQVLSSKGSAAAPDWIDQSSITAGSAGQLTTPRSINGTLFDGTAGITTANWGTARNITISDNDGSNTQTTNSINGSQNFTLKLPASIKATLKGKADTAGTADKLAHDLILSCKNVNDAMPDSVSFGKSHTSDTTFTVSVDKLFFKYETSFQGALSAGTWQALTFATGAGLTTGSYIVQIKTGTNTDKFNNEYFTGVMSYTSETGAGTDSDEVLLHAAGKNLHSYHIYLRTRRVSNGALVIEFQSDVALTNDAKDKLTFYFRRMI